MPLIQTTNTIAGAIPRRGAATAAGAGLGASWVRADYDFAVQGGAVSTIALLGSTAIPATSVILDGYIDVTTSCTSGGAATIAVQVEGAADVLAATAVASMNAGRKSIIPAATGATSVKTTAARDVSIVIATAALTAGKFSVYLEYIQEA